jgi:predicted GTPase
MADLLGRVNASIDSVKAVVAQASAAGVDSVVVDAWKDDLDALKLVPGSVEARIGFIGRTGVGKSQALNAILGEPQLFPVAGSKSCTATVIEAKYHSNANYKADFQFITMVRAALRMICAVNPRKAAHFYLLQYY